MNFQEEFVKNLKFYRKQKNMSQEKLAELCDCGTSTIGCIEIGRQAPSFEMIINIANALEIHPADLFLRETSISKSEMKKQIEKVLIDDIHDILEKLF